MAKWNVSKLYENDQLWLADFDKAKKLVPELAEFKGKLGEIKSFKSYIEKYEQTLKAIYRLYLYAALSSDLNLKDLDKTNLVQQIYSLFNSLSQATAFFAPEVISVGEKTIMSFCDADELIRTYRFNYEDLFRQQAHILDNQGESILANFANNANAGTSLHQSLAIVDRTNEKIVLSAGEEVEVSSATYAPLIQKSVCDEDRFKIFNALYKRYTDNKAAFASTYELVLKQLEASYKSRKYKSALEAKLFSDNVPTSVFMTLVDTTYENTAPLKRYFELRRKILGLPKHNFYDRLLPLVKDSTFYDYDVAYKMFIDSIKGLDQEFVDAQVKALADGYVDVFPTDGKRTGAYSMSLYGFDPFILLNHNGTLDSVFTLAHEAGHSAHSILSNDNQPMATADYTIFVAEIASTFNEHLLLDNLLSKAKSKDEKIAILQEAIDTICGTFYRQTLFATYELKANQLLANGKPITEQSLSDIFIDLYKNYYDIDITKEGNLRLEWAHVPHFFNSPFYVYQYATSYAASLKIYDDVKSNKPGAFEKFKNLLKSGGSDYPVNQAKLAGADLTDKNTYLAVFKRFSQLVDLLEKTYNEK